MGATSSTHTEAPVSLKLLVNKDTNQVLFAEAGKDFVDVLCSFLTFSLGTITRLVQKDSSMGTVTLGCLNSLYQSVEDLDQGGCLRFVASKEMLLQSSESYCRTLKLNIDEPVKYFICPKACNSHQLCTRENQRCSCGNLMRRRVFMKYICEGFVTGDVTFVITDDLTLMPHSIEQTSFGLLQSLGVKSNSSIEEMTVNVTKEKVQDLLKCSLLSKSTLTDLFLRKKPLLEMPRFVPEGILYGIRSSIQIKVKLVIRKSDGKILYAHGEEDFADFLISFLTFPLGAVVRKLGVDCCVGSLGRLYQSIINLNEKYLMSKEEKNRLIDPRLASHLIIREKIIETYDPEYRCYYRRSSFTESIIHDDFFITDENKGIGRYVPMSLVSPSIYAGFVKGATIYIATDELVVAPVSPISAVSLMISLGTPLSDLEEMATTIGYSECLSILKASLTSTSALTNGLRHLLPKVKEEK